MRPHDTSPDAWARLLAGYRALTPEERVRLALEMSDEVAAITASGIQQRHPQWPAARIRAEVDRLLLGADTAPPVRGRRTGGPSRGHPAAVDE